jgi:hypothetical protein
MKIQVEVEIFDDPEYCCKSLPVNLDFELVDKCKNLSVKGECDRFPTGRKDKYLRFTSKRKFEKCPQCKEAYQKAKETKIQTDMLKESMIDPMHPERK